MSIVLNDNLQIRANKPTDDRYGPWTSTTQAHQNISSAYRFTGLTVGISSSTGITEYWYATGTTNASDLVLKFDQASASITYSNFNSMPDSVGGIPAGTSFTSKTMTEMWNMLLYPFRNPSFSSFAADNLISEYDLGRPITIGSTNFSWNTNYDMFVSANTISILEFTSSTGTKVIGSNLANDNAEPLTTTTPLSSTTPQTLSVYRINGVNTTGGTFTSTISRSWRDRWYWGQFTGENITAAIITGATTPGATFYTELKTAVIGTYKTFPAPAVSSFIYLAIPSGFTQPVTFYDNTGGCLGTPFPMTKIISQTGITNQYGVTRGYTIWKSSNSTLATTSTYMCST